MSSDNVLDLAVVGAGPCGLSAGVAARQGGLTCALFDGGCLTRSITLYPTYATFFSTADRLEIGGVPFITTGDKPTRLDALKYYRGVAARFGLDVRQYQEVREVTRCDGYFVLSTRTLGGREQRHHARNVIIATGYAGSPNLLRIPGEDLPNVTHYFREAHPYYDQDCVVVGAGNSAVEAALDLFRTGARVTLVHFLGALDRGIKPWVLPDIQNRLKNGEIRALWHTRLVEIQPERVRLRDERTGEETELHNDFVLALTGYHPDPRLLAGLGVTFDPGTGIPRHDPETMETDVPGVFVAGVLVGGYRPDTVFIEDGRHHGPLAVRRILAARDVDAGSRIALGIPPRLRAVDPEADGIP
jgi:thioredoxin reductase (NADPH)